MESLSISQVWKYLRWVPKFILRRVFTAERLAGLVYIDVQSRHRSVHVNVGESGEFSVYFVLINLSPVEIELDRAEIVLNFAGVQLKERLLKKQKFKSGEIGQLYVSGDVPEEKAKKIAGYWDKNRSSASIHCEFNCVLHSFSRPNGSLPDLNVEYSNVNQWQKPSAVA